MDFLSRICSRSKDYVFSQILVLKRKYETFGFDFIFVNKFFIKLHCPDGTVFFIKMNLLDNEFYVFSKTGKLLIFRSINELEETFIKKFLDKT